MDTTIAGPRTRPATWSSASLRVTAPGPLGFVDLTERVGGLVAAAGISEGICVVFCAHTTATLLINEWEDVEDFRKRLTALFPADAYCAHDDAGRRTRNLRPDERKNGHAHVAQMALGGTSHVIPVADGSLVLGCWQRLFLVELDRPTERTIVVQLAGS